MEYVKQLEKQKLGNTWDEMKEKFTKQLKEQQHVRDCLASDGGMKNLMWPWIYRYAKKTEELDCLQDK